MEREIWVLPCGCARLVREDQNAVTGERCWDELCPFGRRIEIMAQAAFRRLATIRFEGPSKNAYARRWQRLCSQRVSALDFHTDYHYSCEWGTGEELEAG